jgi:hypothetical protein
MINYRIDNRHHIIGAGVQAHGGMWPSSASNWWEAGGATGAVAVYQPKGAASYAASLTDLSGNGNDATEVMETPPTWATGTGWTFAGAGALNTGVAPRTSREWSAFARVKNVNVAGSITYQAALGSRITSGARFYLVFINPNDLNASYGQGYFANYYMGAITSGVMAMAGADGYRDGIDVVDISTYNGDISFAVYIGAMNQGGTRVYDLFGDVLAVAIYNNTLDATKVAAVSAAMAAL